MRSMVQEAAGREPGLAASLLRLAFHDAAARRQGRGGANGSIRFELARSENVGPSLRAALRVAESAALRCRVSLADAVAVAGAAAVEATGGPKIDVGLGRADAPGPDPPGLLPDAGFSGQDTREYFGRLGLGDEEAAAFLGAHTLGRWTSFLGVSGACMAQADAVFWNCTREEGQRLPFTRHPDSFDAEYFQAVAEFYRRKQAPPPTKRYKDRPKGELERLNLLPSDNALMFDERLRPHVLRFAKDREAFFAAFARAYKKLVG